MDEPNPNSADVNKVHFPIVGSNGLYSVEF